MPQNVTIFCSNPDVARATEIVSEYFEVSQTTNFIGEPDLKARLPRGSFRVSTRLRQSPGDDFDRLIVSAFSLVRRLRGGSEGYEGIPEALSHCRLALIVSATPSLSAVSSAEVCVKKLAEELAGAVFDGVRFSITSEFAAVS